MGLNKNIPTAFICSGSAVTKNLLSKNFKVTSIYDINQAQCEGYGCKIAKTPREVMEENDIVITGICICLQHRE